VKQTVSPKEVEYVPGPGGHGAVRREIADERRDAPCLDAEQLASLVDVGRRVEKHFGSRQDIEWALDHRGELFVVQSRPVTATAKRPEATKPVSALDMVMGKFGAKPNA
jgi:pyruvate,water dikinase